MAGWTITESIGTTDEAKSRIKRLDAVALPENAVAIQRVAECRGIDSRRATIIYTGYIVPHDFNL
jgi:hypothetical protein